MHLTNCKKPWTSSNISLRSKAGEIYSVPSTFSISERFALVDSVLVLVVTLAVLVLDIASIFVLLDSVLVLAVALVDSVSVLAVLDLVGEG